MNSIPAADLPQLTTAQMREVDRLMIEEWQISLIQMMENAGRGLAELARHLLGGKVGGNCVIALCGTGNNGGGGLVGARHLHNWGAQVNVILAGSPHKLKQVSAHQWRIVQKMGLCAGDAGLGAADLVLDAMIGYGLVGTPRAPISEWIARANASGARILALDAPTGLDTTTGVPSERCIRADATLTLALPKTGLLQPSAKAWVGELVLADIGVPPEVYAAPSLGLRVRPPFGEGAVVRVRE